MVVRCVIPSIIRNMNERIEVVQITWNFSGDGAQKAIDTSSSSLSLSFSPPPIPFRLPPTIFSYPSFLPSIRCYRFETIFWENGLSEWRKKFNQIQNRKWKAVWMREWSLLCLCIWCSHFNEYAIPFKRINSLRKWKKKICMHVNGKYRASDGLVWK